MVDNIQAPHFLLAYLTFVVAVQGAVNFYSYNPDRKLPDSCTDEYKSLLESTMCVYDDKPYAKPLPLTQDDMDAILEAHNQFRKTIPSTNMQKLYWDPEIAKLAQKWSQVCVEAHDTTSQRSVPGYGIPIGQNLYTGFLGWTIAISSWYKELELFQYGRSPATYLGVDGWKNISHFTQLMNAESGRVGCGIAKCLQRKHYVCNYAWGNAETLSRPWKEGEPCALCPDFCEDGLCDCKGKVCQNGGRLDLATCQCHCLPEYYGDECEDVYCPLEDPWYCNHPYPEGVSLAFCKFRNVRNECPFMCGWCANEPAENVTAEVHDNRDGDKDVGNKQNGEEEVQDNRDGDKDVGNKQNGEEEVQDNRDGDKNVGNKQNGGEEVHDNRDGDKNVGNGDQQGKDQE